jgi:hypothetical protein
MTTETVPVGASFTTLVNLVAKPVRAAASRARRPRSSSVTALINDTSCPSRDKLNGKIERSAAKQFLAADQVPQNFAKARDAHLSNEGFL